MKLRRRALLSTVPAIGAAIAAPAVLGQAAPWPTKPVRILIPFAPGGTSDILARLLQPRLQEALGQSVLVENRPGANGNIAVDMVAKSAPDGTTFVLTDLGSLAISPSVTKVPFDLAKDFAPVTVLAYSPHMLAVRPDHPANSAVELIAYAKANPGKLNNATAGLGSAPHLAGARFAHELGIKWTYVPMKGGAEAVQQVAGSHADLVFNGMVATLPHVKSGKLKGLAVSSAKRHPLAPDLPTIAEASGLKDFVTGSWQGFLSAAGTPAEITARLHAEIVKIVAMPDVAKRFQELGAEPVLSKPADANTWLQAESALWAKVVKDAGIKLE
ncbi:MAG: tripartite tricarboxylate transporter substrate binding protein [Rhodospirillales bacterium]|nr:MAG: tripartite tricarboxylate transporter substrate binding protein [Rhodospirillales bacterium]